MKDKTFLTCFYALASIALIGLCLVAIRDRSTDSIALLSPASPASAAEQLLPEKAVSSEAEQAEISTETVPDRSIDPPASNGPININTASFEELCTLPGIGEVLAQRILDYRTAYGDFVSLEELMDINGIGEKKFAAIKALIAL